MSFVVNIIERSPTFQQLYNIILPDMYSEVFKPVTTF